jgi:hypothetical protein
MLGCYPSGIQLTITAHLNKKIAIEPPRPRSRAQPITIIPIVRWFFCVESNSSRKLAAFYKKLFFDLHSAVGKFPNHRRKTNFGKTSLQSTNHWPESFFL